MSNVIDERVVEMRFDNKDFEKNVQTTMSTIEKLKAKLNFKGAAKGIDDIGSSMKKVDTTGFGRGIEVVTAKFSAMQVAGMTAISNITTSLMDMASRTISALTIDPIKDGMAEYETQMNAVQTILANTQKEGTNVEKVNAALDELNIYADKTIYNFTEMTRNIGTFTAAGVKLDTSVSAIKGIANLAAVSGSTSLQASTAMYQLSQAIAAGSVKLQDWNSVVNAGMGGQVFQDALIRTSENLQTGAKASIEAAGSFRESLKDGWITTEVLTQTLDQFATAAETEQEYEEAVKKFVNQGYSKEQATQMADMARTANNAATKVKTFTQLIDTLKEAMGSGWTKSWQLIIGDFEEAKEMWSKVSDVFSGIIDRTSDFRNAVLGSALGKGFADLADKINGVTEPVENAINVIEDLGTVVDDVILGKFGNGQTRFDALAAAGYNYCVVQNKVNETLGNGFRYTEEQITAQNELLGTTQKETDGTTELTDEKKKLIKEIVNLSEEEMKAKGYTEEQIEAFKELRSVAEKLGIPLNDFIDNMDQINGRWLLLHSFENIGNSIAKVFKTIGEAYTETFGEITVDDLASNLFDAIAAFHKFTSSMIMSDESAGKLKRTFKGLFAILDVVTTFLNGGVKLAVKGVSAVLNAFDLDILDVTAGIGDAAVAFRDFLFSNDLIDKGFEKFGSGVKMVVKYIDQLISTAKNLPQVQNFFNRVKKVDLSKIGSDTIESLKRGMEDGVTGLPGALLDIAKNIFYAITDAFAIDVSGASLKDAGKDAIESFGDGVKSGAGSIVDSIKEKRDAVTTGFNDFKDTVIMVWKFTVSGISDAIKTYVPVIKDALDSIDWGKTIAVGGIFASLITGVKIVTRINDTIDKFAAPFESMGKLLESASKIIDSCTENINKILESFSKKLKAEAFKTRAEGIKELAIAIGILTAAIYVLTKMNPEQMWMGVGAIAALAAILVALSFAMDKLSSASATVDRDGLNLSGLKTGLVGIGVALILMAATVKIIGGMNPDEVKQGFLGLAGIVVAIAGVLAVFGLLVKGKSAQNIDKAGKMMKKMAIAVLLMAVAAKLIGTLSGSDMSKGIIFAGGFIIFTGLLTAISKLGGRNMDKFSSMMIKMAIAMGLMVMVTKLAGTLSVEQILKGAAFAGGFVIFVALLRKAASAKSGTEIAKLSGLLISISLAMALMIGVTKLASTLSAEEILKGAAFAGGFLIFVGALKTVASTPNGAAIAKLSGLLLSISISMAIMVGVVKLIGLLSVGDIVKGTVAVVAFGAMIISLAKAVNSIGPDAPKMGATLLAMSAAIGIMAGIAVLLSFVDVKDLAKGVIAVGALSAMMTAMIWATRGASDCMKNLIVMTAAVGVMASAVALLSFLDTRSLLGATACLSALMLSFALMAKASSSAGGSLESLMMMTLVVGALAGICVLMANIPVETTLTTCTGLSMMMVTFSASLLLISKAGDAAINAWKGVLMMVGIMALLAGMLVALQKLKFEASLKTAASLSILMLALSASCLILSKVGTVSNGAVMGAAKLMAIIGVMALIFGVIGGLIGRIPDAQAFLDNGIPVLEKLGYGLGAFFGNIVGGFTAGITSGLPEIGTNLTAFMDNIQGFLTGVEGVDSSALDGVKTLADTVLEITQASFLDQIMSVLPFFEDNPIESLVEDIKIFVIGLAEVTKTLNSTDEINTTKLSEIAAVGEAFAKLQNTAAKTKGLVQAITGENDLGNFGVQIRQYANNLNRAAYAVKSISAEGMDNLDKIADIGDTFAALQKTIEPTKGIMQDIEGVSDLGDFGKQIADYASNVNTAASGVSEISDSGVANLDTLAGLGTAFTDLQKTIEPVGGIQKLLGEKDLGDFGTDISKYASSLKEASDSLTGENAIDQTAIEAATSCGTLLTELQKALPEEHWFDGKMNLSDFSTPIKNFGAAVGAFGRSVRNVDKDKMTDAVTIGGMLKEFTNEIADIDTSGIKDFANNKHGSWGVQDIGSAIKSFSDYIAESDISSVSKGVSVAYRLKSFVNGLGDFSSDLIENFTVDSLGEALSSYSTSVASMDVDNVARSVDGANSIVNLIKSLAGLDTSGVSKFTSAVSELSNAQINDAANTLESTSTQLSSAGNSIVSSLSQGMTDKSGEASTAATGIVNQIDFAIRNQALLFVTAGTVLMLKLIDGIKSQNNATSEAATAVVQSASNSLNSFYYSFYTSGTYLGTGLVNGINNQKQSAYDAGYALGKAAVEGERAGQESHSPSKATEQSGIWLGQGLIIGINKMQKNVSRAGSGMGKAVTSSLSSTISRIGDAIEHSSDYTPTIRPVVDLTDVKTGANKVGGLFSGISLDANTNLKAISTSMSMRGQNGFSDDVVDAINRLGKKLGNTGNTSYTIGDVNYEEGSDVAEAMQIITRAATVNRRR